MGMIKKSLYCALIFNVISCNLLQLHARPIGVSNDNNDGQLEVVEITNNPLEILANDPLFIPELNSDPPSSSPRRRHPDLSGMDFDIAPALSALSATLDDFDISPAAFSDPFSPDAQPSVLYRGEGETSGSNGNKDDTWWYEILTNGELHTSPNFFNDQDVPPEVKSQVQRISDHLKNGGMFT